MRKSEVHVLQGLLFAILDDYVQSYPSDAIEVDRDKSRLSLAVQTRGLSTFLLDLPSLGKHFDQCLDSGVFTRPKLPLSGGRWSCGPIPKLFSGLIVRVFERGSGSLLNEVDPNVVMFLRQIYNFAKGYDYACSQERTEKSVLEFYAIDQEVETPDLNWSDDLIDTDRVFDLHVDDLLRRRYPGWYRERDLEVPPDSWVNDGGFGAHYQKGFDIVASKLGAFDPHTYSPRHGPGAVSDLRGSESKYLFPHWSEKLEQAFPFADFAFANYADWAAYGPTTTLVAEAPGRLLIVPKTAKAPRLIAAEPTSHQWCQQVILRFLVAGIERSFLRNSISLDDQEPSRALAQRASQDRSYSTIDLSSASDRISTALVERAFRSNKLLLRAFHSVRTRYIINGTGVLHPSIPEGQVPLRKFTTMGSACTFPVQSVLFATIAILTILYQDREEVSVASLTRASKRVRVFGDDIIVPTRYDEAVRWTLSVFGLKVNHAKSFRIGNFREACGMDAFKGHDVTPARLNACPETARPSTLISAIDASNNFFEKGYWRASAYIESLLPRWVKDNLPTVAMSSGRVGLKSFCGYSLDHLKHDWDDDLHKVVVRVLTHNAKVSRYPQTGQHDLFQFYIEKPQRVLRIPLSLHEPTIKWEPGRSHVLREYLTLRRVPLESIVP